MGASVSISTAESASAAKHWKNGILFPGPRGYPPVSAGGARRCDSITVGIIAQTKPFVYKNFPEGPLSPGALGDYGVFLLFPLLLFPETDILYFLENDSIQPFLPPGGRARRCFA